MVQDDLKTNEKLYENKKDGNIGMSGSNSKVNKSQNDEKSLLNENTGNEINLTTKIIDGNIKLN